MSVKHMSLVFEHLHVKPAQKLVALVLADHANADGICWPSYARIAEYTDMDKRTIQRHVKFLIGLGVVSKLRTGHIVKNGDNIIRISNAYRVNAEILIQLSTLSPDSLLINDEIVHSEGDKNIQSWGGGLSTKPSYNHHYNSKRKKVGDIEQARFSNILREIASNS